MGSFPRVDAGELKLTMDTPVEGYENLELMCEYRLPTVDEEGHFNGRLSTTKGGLFQLQARGTTRDLSGSFSSPFEPFRYVDLQYLIDRVALSCYVMCFISKVMWSFVLLFLLFFS